MISVVLCDDHAIVRKGLRQLLETNRNISVMAEVASGEELLKELRIIQPDVVVLDIALPGRSGLDTLKQIKQLYPHLQVLILSMFSEEQFAIRMLKAGASGYLNKDSTPENLFTALRTVAEGKKYISPEIAVLLVEEISLEYKNRLPHNLLSDREFEVMLLLGKGKKVSEIAEMLLLSIKTVSTYKARILIKLKIDSVAALARYISEHQLELVGQ